MRLISFLVFIVFTQICLFPTTVEVLKINYLDGNDNKCKSKHYYVSVNGNDSNQGSDKEPFRTIGKASGLMKPGDTCFVFGGIYREMIKPQKKGLKDKPIVFCSVPGDKVIISAMEVTSFDFKEGNAINYDVKFDLGNENAVFCDGEPMILARWPNKTNVDLMDIEGGIIRCDGSSPKGVRCDKYPKWFSSKKLDGATIWVNAESKWSSWTSHVVGYDKKLKEVSLKAFGKNWWVNERHNPGRIHEYGEGVFYIAGAEALLDVPNEWYFDKKKNSLKVIMPKGKSHNSSIVEMRKRQWTVNLEGCSNIEIIGMEMIGAPAKMDNCNNSILRACNLRNFYFAFGYNSAMALEGDSGIILGGLENTIRDCEISGSAGNGIILKGEYNNIINCNIHNINFLGSHDAAAINLSGKAHFISYNSVHNVGRVCIRMNGGRHIVQYNHLYKPGRISEDLGCIKWAGQDADNTIIHHNLIENDNDKFIGIYFDNYTNNVVAHHNIVKGVDDGIRSNRPGHYHIIYNNTVSPDINNYWGPWDGSFDQFGNVVANNIYEIQALVKPEVFTSQNHQLEWTNSRVLGCDLNNGERSFPDLPIYIGAVTPNTLPFYTGHNFEEEYEIESDFTAQLPFIRNHLRNGCFDFIKTYSNALSKNKDELGLLHWKKTKSKNAEIEFFAGFNYPTNPENRYSIHAYSLCLSGKNDDGVFQEVKTLKSNRTYILSGYVKMKDAEEIMFSVMNKGIKLGCLSTKEVEVGKSNWKFMKLEFKTGDDDGDIVVYIEKKGKGVAYIDDVGLLPIPLND